MAFLRTLTFGVLLVSAQAVTPMEKVISLLEDLKKDTIEEGKTEAATYDKFACFCKDATEKKSKSITEGQDKIDTTNADIGKKTATKQDKITAHGKEQDKLEATTLKLKETTEQYNKDKAAYTATNNDLTKAVNSAKRAHKALSESKPAFIQLGVKSDVQNCLDLAMALGMVSESKHEAASSFLQVDPNDPAFKFHSDKILSIIKELQDDFQKEKDTLNEEWQKTDKTFKAEKLDLEDKIDTAEKQITKLSGEIDKLKADIAKLNEDLVTAEDNLKDDSNYLRDLTDRCEANAQAWDQRTKTRDGEVNALTKALDIINNRAKDADAAVNKRALLIHAKPAAVAKAVVETPVKAKAAAPAADVKTAPVKTVKKAISFLQASSSSRALKAQEILRDASIVLKSSLLSSAAEQIMANPFIKIKKLIQGLIDRLLEESKGEATKKGFCDTELGKSRHDRDSRFAEVYKIDTETSELEAHKKALTLEIEELGDEIKDLGDDLDKATTLRGEEKVENAKTIKDATAGGIAVGEALVVLKDFYKDAAKNTVFLQASPVDEDTQFEDLVANKGDQSASKGILGLLEVIKTDFERTTRKTEAAEKKSLEDFVNFERTSKSDIASKTTKKALDNQDLESTTSAIAANMKDLKTAQKLLDQALLNIEDLKPVCIDTGMSYAERVQKREDEITALGKALCALDPDKVESECQ